MAKRIWVFTASLTGITSKLYDTKGNEEKYPQLHHLYTADEGGADIASDGSKPLYHSVDGIIDPMRLGGIVNKPAQPPVAATDFTLSGTTKGDVGATGKVVVTPIPAGATPPTVTYVSSKPDIATIDNAGNINFIKPGFVTFSVTGLGKTKDIEGETTNANAATFASAHTYNNYGVSVEMSDNSFYGHVHTEWELKVNGAVVPHQHVSNDDSDTTGKSIVINFTNAEHPTPPMKAGDTITVSHKVAASGIAAFTDKPVTNNLQ